MARADRGADLRPADGGDDPAGGARAVDSSNSPYLVLYDHNILV